MSEQEQQQRPPDELDALLQKIDDNEQQQQQGSHRKSYSLFVGYGSGGGSSSTTGGPGKRRHRKNKSSISELYDAIRNVDLEPIREDFRATAENVKFSFLEELNEMDRGETGFFDMTMSRSLSVLPEDIQDLAHEAGYKERTDKSGPPLVQYLALLSAVFAVSSNSTGFHMLDGVEPPMKQYWKMTASWVAMSPLAVHYFLKEGIPKLSLVGWLTFVAAIACFSTSNVLFVTSLEYTTIGNAVTFANSQSLLLIIGKACVGDRIHVLEGVGVLIAFTGAILCSRDADAQSSRESDTKTNGLYGDFLALGSAIAGVSYLTFAKSVRSGISVSVFVFSVMFFGSFFILIYMAAINSENEHPIEWNADPYDGIFGWLTLHRLPILIYLAVMCNMVGTMGFVRAMEYFDNVVIAVATLMEPLMASLIAFACHAGLLPGPLGWLGNMLVVVGSLAVVYPSIVKQDAS